MKPIELCELSITEANKECSEIYGADKTQLLKYINQDCIICYNSGALGNVFIIKTKTKYMAFFSINKVFKNYIYNSNRIRRCVNLDLILKTTSWKIVNRAEYQKMNKWLVIESLKK